MRLGESRLSVEGKKERENDQTPCKGVRCEHGYKNMLIFEKFSSPIPEVKLGQSCK